MQFSFYALTDPGQVRTNNEDAVVFDEGSGVAILADGMGGYNAGEVASGMAVTFIKSELVQWLNTANWQHDTNLIARGIGICIDRANQSILNAALSNPQYAGMGTTVVAGVFKNNCLILGHVGDSRCYRLRHGKLTQITKDHSLLQEQVDAGLLTPEQALLAPGKNLLTRALGVDSELAVEIHAHEVQDNDLFLMCSDGLTDMLSDLEIASCMKKCAHLPDMAAELISGANLAGGRDNISALLAQAKATSTKSGLISNLFGAP